MNIVNTWSLWHIVIDHPAKPFGQVFTPNYWVRKHPLKNYQLYHVEAGWRIFFCPNTFAISDNRVRQGCPICIGPLPSFLGCHVDFADKGR